MSSGPGILYIWPGLIIPVRFSISVALLFISVKANVVAFYAGHDWSNYTSHRLLVVNAAVNLGCSILSVLIAWTRDEDKLPPRLRWNCAAFGLVVRIILFSMAIPAMVAVANDRAKSYMRLNESVLAEITLTLLLICLVVGAAHKLRTMRAAHEAGEEEVQRELVKRSEPRIGSPSSTTMSSPITLQSHPLNNQATDYSPETLYESSSSAEKGELAAQSTVTLVNTRHLDYQGKSWEVETPRLPPFERQ